MEDSSETGELQGVLPEGASAGPEEGNLDVVEGECSVTVLPVYEHLFL